MPKELTDVSQFDAVDVPVGADARTAGSVEIPFQQLADRTRYLLNLLASYMSAAYLNLQDADISALSVIDGAKLMAGCMSTDTANQRIHTIIDDDGQTAICMHSGKASPTPGGGGVYWEDEGDTPTASLTWTVAGTLVDVCAGWNGVFPERLAVSNSATGQVAMSPTAGSWSAVAGGVAGTTWTACENGYNAAELWVIGGNAGAMATSINASSTVFTSRTSGLSGAVIRIRSNRKPTAGDHRFLALDDAGNVSISSADGTTWTATLVGSLGLTSTLQSITWDAKNDRWVGVQYNGFRAWSTDGITWTESADDELPDFTAAAGNRFFLDADDQGNLILGVHSVGNRAFLYVAGNGGDDMPSGRPWEEAFFPGLYTSARITFMGHGKMIAAGGSGIVYSDEAFTTRWAA